MNTTRLEDHTQYSDWIKAAYTKATRLGIFELIDPNDDTNPMSKPKAPLDPTDDDDETFARPTIPAIGISTQSQSSLSSTLKSDEQLKASYDELVDSVELHFVLRQLVMVHLVGKVVLCSSDCNVLERLDCDRVDVPIAGIVGRANVSSSSSVGSSGAFGFLIGVESSSGSISSKIPRRVAFVYAALIHWLYCVWSSRRRVLIMIGIFVIEE